MGFCITTQNLPCLRSYDDALNYWERVKPIRGRAADSPRPLRRDRGNNDTMVIDRKPNGDVVCRLYRTDCVVYHTDGRISIDATYTSQSTAAFIDQVSPFRAIMHLNQIYVGPSGRHFCCKHVLVFEPNGADWVCTNPPKLFRKVLDKPRAAEVRKKLKPLTNYIKVTNQIVNTSCQYGHASTLRRVVEGLLDDTAGGMTDLFEAARLGANTAADPVAQAHSVGYHYYDAFIEEEVPYGDLPKRRRW